MIQGTGSDVGKSLLVAGLCRAYSKRGLRVMPFKPQNMSNNAAVTQDGGEIGRAQALQARAANQPLSVHMNPVLLKPQSETGAQVVVQGRVEGTAEARDYHDLKPKLLHRVLESFGILATDADLVVVEGAGSPAEVNLRPGDIANMGFAEAADINVVLIADVERGGALETEAHGDHRHRALLHQPGDQPAGAGPFLDFDGKRRGRDGENAQQRRHAEPSRLVWHRPHRLPLPGNRTLVTELASMKTARAAASISIRGRPSCADSSSTKSRARSTV